MNMTNDIDPHVFESRQLSKKIASIFVCSESEEVLLIYIWYVFELYFFSIVFGFLYEHYDYLGFGM